MSMDPPGSITNCIRDLEGGEQLLRDEAARELWEHYFADMMIFARKRLRAMHAPLGPADEEDAAARAFMKVCRGIERGQLKLASRLDLTKVLRSATTREVFTILGRNRTPGDFVDQAVLEEITDPALPSDVLLLALDACQRLLDLLETNELRQVAIWKLVGYTNEAIGLKLGRSPATVERTLSQIRETWRLKWGDAVLDPAKPGPRRGTRSAALDPADQGVDHVETDNIAKLLRDLAGLT